ncbi:MAG: hypothetical protein NTZ48_06465 [Candidatus Omnitrophica bacterium]|nr:hypothetical protein [Candidatus Omnitrophota bacterium]
MAEGVLKDLGPCQVVFDSVDLGPTAGDVVLKDAVESKPIKEDQEGTTEQDGVFVGRSCEVIVPLTRSSLATLASVIPGATKPSTNLMEVKGVVGKVRSDDAGILILKPIVDGVAGPNTTWLTLPNASPSPDMEITFNNETQRVYKVAFKALPDANNVLYKIGA